MRKSAKKRQHQIYSARQVFQKVLPLKDHETAFNTLIKLLKSEGVVNDLSSEIALVGHRVVMGGSFYQRATLATPKC
ncbi:hypothetical protein [Mycoplasma sp. ATU-Cv-508]|uniref:hypothetical protein n=1 Tax=Mycoplasma sp. ATU-Cv-508 TaxID=2048001 RepID=UPI000FDCF5D5